MSKDCVIVFEDEHYPKFYPLSLSRPTYNLLCGSKTNLERIKEHFSDFELFTICRPHLSCKRIPNGQFNKIIFINGRAVFSRKDLGLINELKKNDESTTYIKDGMLIAAILKNIKEPKDIPLDIIENSKKIEEVDILTFSYIWDIVLENQKLIEQDFDEYFKDKGFKDKIGDSFVYGKKEIFVSDGGGADFASVIDARGGPIIIGRGVEIKPFTYLEGPVFIGDGCKLVGGKITAGCSLGNGCRVGGEIENTIIIGNTNKYHEGFIGHSYIGEWVNLGALTTNSDLKNNYSEISVKQNGIMTKTGGIKIGCFIGDHTKIGIGTTLNTGINIGFSCNLFGGGLIMEKETPSFTWGNDSLRRIFSLKDAVETAKIVLKRRGILFDNKHYRLFEHIFNESKIQREAWLYQNKNGLPPNIRH